MFTAQYALVPYIRGIHFFLKMINQEKSDVPTRKSEDSDVFVRVAMNRWWNNSDRGERQTWAKSIDNPEIT